MGDDLSAVAAAANLIEEFLALRDLPELSLRGLAERGHGPVDVLVLFGACPPHVWDVVGEAYRVGVAHRLLVVGGVGHTTEALWDAVEERLPGTGCRGRPEADVIADYLCRHQGLEGLLVERRSSNCGKNVTAAQQTLDRAGVDAHSLLFVQDATMQRRMDAVFRRHWTAHPGAARPTLFNWAAYRSEFVVRDGSLDLLERGRWGAWSVRHHMSLLMGEVARLAPRGYGPKGRDFIAHVDVPEAVQAAFETLLAAGVGDIRPADPRFASGQDVSSFL